ncbi:thioredoxin family protein [Bacillus timonensis]|uniref:Thioredoxin family protein n=1 Tax=Bacillus timonensis TaxID=1033734 RepID=A0A4S3PQ77_9BACI|nr:thioredoxin family protein [Bacillus timonensis]THE11797.1 thioredoxin family protein [Bacillus timonensis]
MTNLKPWFEKGMNQYDYINSMKVHKENLLKVYNQFRLDESDKDLLQALQEKELKAIILAADWCGDAMVNLPILMRIADEALLETRYLIRDENLELMDQYLTNGKSRSIPIIIFVNKDFEEVGKWGPRAPEAQVIADELKAQVPDKESPEYDAAFKAFIKSFTERITTDEALWNNIKNSIISTLKDA